MLTDSLKLLPNNKIDSPSRPDKVPITNLVVTFNNLNNQTINKVNAGTIEITKVKIPASILGATINSTDKGTMYAKIPATEKNRDFLIVILKSFFLNKRKLKNKKHRTAKSGTKIENGLSSASTILTKEKCNAHKEDNKNNNKVFLYSYNLCI